MRSRKFLIGVAVLGLLAAAAMLAVLAGSERIGGIVLIAMVLVVAVFALGAVASLRRIERQLQRLDRAVRSATESMREQKPTPPVASVHPLPREEDLLGTVRLLQAQYVGRLDRLEGKVEAAVDRLAASNDHQH